jgi:hypothetical protein
MKKRIVLATAPATSVTTSCSSEHNSEVGKKPPIVINRNEQIAAVFAPFI